MSKNQSVCECDDQTHRKVEICGQHFFQCQECFSIVEIPANPPTVKPSLIERCVIWLAEGLEEIRADDMETEMERKRDQSFHRLCAIALALVIGAIILAVCLAPSVVK